MIELDRASIGSFLRLIGRGQHLCSIVPDGACVGQWFGDDFDAATDWAAAENALGNNLYWTVNLVAEGLNKKPKKSDIVGARFVHVDIDPPKGGGPLDKLQTHGELLALPVPPTLIIDSGGGLQAFWRLAGPASQEDVEQANRGVADQFGGDNCHNIDRLMRVAGTINYPTAKKKSAGRCISLAKVIYDATRALH